MQKIREKASMLGVLGIDYCRVGAMSDHPKLSISVKENAANTIYESGEICIFATYEELDPC
jgi:hypothetical protein